MNRKQLISFARDSWILILIVIGCIAFALYYKETQPDAPADAAVAPAESTVGSTEGAQIFAPDAERQSALKIIQEHQAQYDADRTGPDAPALLFAMGNLYLHKLLDRQEAARCYELVAAKFPAWDGISMVYQQLIVCYQELRDREN
ncbi:MAG TPA: hypothetical protein PKZ01_12565, partial [Candidatus Hydrogenedentes bacterium]|nr:hypothetical protein [Candidatus Hydrogenedentota bacterium]